MEATIAYWVVALFAAGMALAFFLADRDAPTSRALALNLGLLAVTFALNVPALRTAEGSPNFWPSVFALLEIGILCTGFEWILRVGRTAERPPNEILIRTAQGLAVAYGLLGVVFPAARLSSWNTTWTPEVLARSEHYLFALPFYGAALCTGVFVQRVFRSGIDPAERVRVQFFGGAALCWAAGVPLTGSPGAQALAFAAGEAVFLMGAIRYHVLQGRRGEFLGRFVSPQLVQTARESGLASMMARTRSEISVVACDLRGFTSFAESAAPEDVMRLLDEYYATVGAAVTEHGGSIKDFAGDGILALVGAPIPEPDHARRALCLAVAVQHGMDGILQRWRALGVDLGVGVGVATGFATTGAIGGSGRLEYAAVGPVVNLASRLCGHAASGQVLADARAVGLAGEAPGLYRIEVLGSVELKGLARPTKVFAVSAPQG